MAKEMPAALQKGDMIQLSIDAVAFGGQGVGRFRNQVVFVPFTADGDDGTVAITEVRKRYARGELKALTTPSPHRMAPPCTAFALCGGCQYQHIVYDHQLVIKKRQVLDAFVRIGMFADPPLADPIPSPEPWRYRGKAEVHVQWDQGLAVGFSRASSHDICDIYQCLIVEDSVNEALARLRQGVTAMSSHRGQKRRVVLWSTEGNGASPAGYIRRIVKGRELLLPRSGFFQANRFLAGTLVDVVLKMSALTGRETVVDAYCGSGFFSLFLAAQARAFHGIELAGEAVRAAKMNLMNAGIHHARFYEGDVGAVLASVFAPKRRRVDVLVVDPPRTGLGPAVLSAIAQLRPGRMVYVSCNPATMARDSRCLADYGYVLMALQPLDMFPQTSHIEAVGLLTLMRPHR